MAILKVDLHTIRPPAWVGQTSGVLKSIFIKWFLKLFNPTSCLIMSGKAFHILGAKYLHDFKPCLVELILGSVKMFLPRRLYVVVLR